MRQDRPVAVAIETILRFRHLTEKHDLAADMLRVVNAILRDKGLMVETGTVVGTTLIAAPSSTGIASGECHPEMQQTKKGKQWCFGMKAHIGVDAPSRLVHSVADTAASINDVTQDGALPQGHEQVAFSDPGDLGLDKRPEARKPQWHVSMRPGCGDACARRAPSRAREAPERSDERASGAR